MRFHAIHCVPSNDETSSSAGGRPLARGSPRHITARFVCREDRNFIWKNRNKIKELQRFNKAFFVPDLAKELTAENCILRGAARRAKEKKIRVAIRRNQLVMLDSGLSYSANEVPQYLRTEISSRNINYTIIYPFLSSFVLLFDRHESKILDDGS